MIRDLASTRKAKIVCTLGPAVDDDDVLAKLISHGMDAARLNLSFGTLEEHARRIQQVRRLNEAMGRRPVGIIADLPGRKARLGRLEGGRVALETEDVVRFVPDEGQAGDARGLPAPPALFRESLVRGDTILLSDGVVELSVVSASRHVVEAEVVFGGRVGERTGLHAAGLTVEGEPITPEDGPYLEMALDLGVDFLSLSWVCDDEDVLSAKEKLAERGADIPIIAKIERPEAFARLDGILRRSDAVMIRRGDLGAQIEVTRVPLVQKEILRLANRSGVPVIIATQMLGSMIGSPRPSRAEASDVSNAIADGADGVLLSAETSIGTYPVEAVDMMARIIQETETERFDRSIRPPQDGSATFADTTASIAVEAAERTGAKLIACFTESGRTARLVSKYRPRVPVLAFCHSGQSRRRLALQWAFE
ncbi:MAG: pyruvate kinase, partial [Myxococcales bacterium]|nr:pyruvate kinase [Myxococcales bacterium]